MFIHSWLVEKKSIWKKHESNDGTHLPHNESLRTFYELNQFFLERYFFGNPQLLNFLWPQNFMMILHHVSMDFFGFLPIVHVCSMLVSGSIHLLGLPPACHGVQIGCKPMSVRNQSAIDVLLVGKNGLLVERPQYIDYHHTPTIPTNPARKVDSPMFHYTCWGWDVDISLLAS